MERGLYEVRNIAVSIQRPPADVYAYVTSGENIPRWARGLGTTVRCEGDGWIAEGPIGEARIRFAPPNDFGVADHDVVLGTGARIHNPMRVVPNGAGSTVIFTLLRQPGVTAAQYDLDAKAVEKDLTVLKSILEGG